MTDEIVPHVIEGEYLAPDEVTTILTACDLHVWQYSEQLIGSNVDRLV